MNEETNEATDEEMNDAMNEVMNERHSVEVEAYRKHIKELKQEIKHLKSEISRLHTIMNIDYWDSDDCDDFNTLPSTEPGQSEFPAQHDVDDYDFQ